MFHDDHQSGKFNANPAQRTAMLAQIVRTCDIAALTEQAGLPFPVKNWMDTGDETKIAWNHAVWRLYGHGVVPIPTVRYKRGTDYRTSVPLVYAVVEHRVSGLLLLRFAGHPPAHRYIHANAVANRQFLDGLEPALTPLIHQFKPDETTGSCDFNRHLGLARNEELVHKSVEHLGLHVLVPPKATHGAIFKIDGFMTDAPGGLSMLDRKKGYDHRGIRRVSLTHGRNRG